MDNPPANARRMKMYAHPMHPHYLTRPVDARWRRINELVDRGQSPSHEYDDAWIKRGCAYRHRLRECNVDEECEHLAIDYPEIAAAYCLHSIGDKLARAVVEARLLAGQSITDVAAATGMTAEAVEAYEAVFFQVIGRLDAPLFIIPEATGMPLTGEGVCETDTDILLKFFAYKAGPLYLELVLRYIRNGMAVPQRFNRASRAELDELVTMLEIRSVMLAKVLPFEQCSRALLAMHLANELKAYIRTMSEASCDEECLREILMNIRLAARNQERKVVTKRQAERKPPNHMKAFLQSVYGT